MKTPAELNAQLAQKMLDFVPWNEGDAVSVKVDHTYIRVQSKNVAAMAAKIKSAHRTFPAGAYKRMGNGRRYPIFEAGMTTKEYIIRYCAINNQMDLPPIDFAALGDRPAALYENGALDFDVIEEPNEDYFSDAAAQDVAEVIAQALTTIAITEAMADTSEDTRELVTCEAGESEASAPTAGQAAWSPIPQYVTPSLSQVKPGEPVPPAFRGGMDDIDPPSGGNAEPTPRPVESTDFSGDIPLSLAVSAFGGVSMSPERRGQSAKSEYAQSMSSDYAELRTQATKGGTLDLLPEVFARYRSRQAGAYRAYLSSSSRCVSSFIAGPSNFPAARMNKRADISHRRLTEYLDGGKMALQAAIRTLRPDLRAIMAGDADAIDRLTVKIESAERAQASMKAANKAIRANAKLGEAHQVAALMELGYRESDAVSLLHPQFAHQGQGFASYSLTNNNANIRRMRERLEQISKAQAQEVQAVECANGVTLEDDAPANRVRLFFPGKPAEAIRDELKASGFRWAPSVGAWQAYRNHGTLATARRMAGEPLPAAPEVADVAEVEQVERVEPIEATPTVAVSTEAPTPAPVEFLSETPAPAAKIIDSEGCHMAAGRADFAAGKPRILPSYFIGISKNAKDWYRGWDAANLETPTPPAAEIQATTPAMETEVTPEQAKSAPTVETLLNAGFNPAVADSIARHGIEAYGPMVQAEIMAKLESMKTPTAETEAPQGQQVKSKSGKWSAWLYITGLSMYGLRFDSFGATTTGSFENNGMRMAALKALALAADAPTDTPPGGGLPCPAEAPTTPVATSTPGTPVAESTPMAGVAVSGYDEREALGDDGQYRYQFQANTDGGQTVGNQMRVQQNEDGSWSQYLSVNGAPEKLFRVRETLNEVIPSNEAVAKGWAIPVKSFADDRAVKHGQSSDAPVAQSTPGTRSAVSSEFQKTKPPRFDLNELIKRGIKPEALIGMGVYCSGDMANPAGSGAITATGNCEWYGLTVDVTLESGYVWKAVRTREFLDGWFSLDAKMHGAPYMAELAAKVAALKASASSAEEQKATAHAKALIDLAAQYPQLKRSDSDYSGGKLAAVNARILLKAAFKGVKFSVKSDYNRLRIEWQDGPTDAQVNAVVGRFDIGASDSMTDYFYTVSTAFSKLFGGVQYMTTKRNTSDALIQQAIDKLYAKREEKPTVQDYRKCAGVFDWNGQSYENRRMRETLETISYA